MTASLVRPTSLHYLGRLLRACILPIGRIECVAMHSTLAECLVHTCGCGLTQMPDCAASCADKETNENDSQAADKRHQRKGTQERMSSEFGMGSDVQKKPRD